MSKCAYCHEKKGKRSCPALGGEICSACCGEHRGKEIACPSDCVYFMPNEAYQQERVAGHFLQSWVQANRAISQALGEKGALVGRFLDLLLFQYFYQRPDLNDPEVKLGLETLKRRFSPLHLPQAGHPPFGAYLLKEWDAFQKEKEAIPNDLAAAVIERYLQFISEFSGGESRSVRFIRGLVGFINQRNPEWAKQVREKQKQESPIIKV